MIAHAYSIYDRKGLIYHPPFFAVADGVASRMFNDLVNDPQTTIGRHPMDYVLFRVGNFDDAKALLLAETPVHIVDGHALARSTVNPVVEGN